METLTMQRALELLGEVVNEFGADYRYPTNVTSRTCDYVRDDKPSCIVGQVAYRYGIGIDTMKEWDERYPEGVRADLALAGYATGDARVLLRIAQTVQDRGHAWGEALKAAEQYAEGDHNSSSDGLRLDTLTYIS